MRFSSTVAALAATLLQTALATPTPNNKVASLARNELWGHTEFVKRSAPIAPKFFIVSMFDPEAAVWYDIPEFNVLAQNISLPGLSPLFPEIHCTADGDICQFTLGESGKRYFIFAQKEKY